MTAIRHSAKLAARARASTIPRAGRSTRSFGSSTRSTWCPCRSDDGETVVTMPSMPRKRRRDRSCGETPVGAASRGWWRLSPEWKLSTMVRELRAAGLLFHAIGVVAGVWWGDQLTDRQVEHRLGVVAMNGQPYDRAAPREYRLRLIIEDGYVRIRVVHPQSGCTPEAYCSNCGRSFEDTERKPCYDCDRVPSKECWITGWVDNCSADELLHGTP